jgi:hypothetical protein
MKNVQELTREQLVDIVEQVQGLLYLDQDTQGSEVWNPAKSWSPGLLDDIAGKLAEYELVPSAETQPESPILVDEMDRLIEQIEGAENNTLLDDLVIDLKCSEGSAINNVGVRAQVEYLVSALGEKEAIRQITEILAEYAAGQDQPD